MPLLVPRGEIIYTAFGRVRPLMGPSAHLVVRSSVTAACVPLGALIPAQAPVVRAVRQARPRRGWLSPLPVFQG